MHGRKGKVRPRFRDTCEMLAFIRAMIKRSELAIQDLDRGSIEEEQALEELKKQWPD
jgi:hypothetical protein